MSRPDKTRVAASVDSLEQTRTAIAERIEPLGLTLEHVRILIAIDEGRMGFNRNGRYVIDGEERPDRKSREQLRGRGLAVPWYTQGKGTEWRLTAKGKAKLREAGFTVKS